MTQAITIIGSTGSIGRQTLEVIKAHPDKWRITGLAAYTNIDLLEEQIKEFQPDIVAVFDEEKAEILKKRIQKRNNEFSCQKSTQTQPELKSRFHNTPIILTGNKGWTELATNENVQKVVFASAGITALDALKQAIKAQKQIALANKEMIVEEGEVIMRLAAKNNVKIIPIDSEHSAIFQCLQGEDPKNIEKIILTCSGGPFIGKTFDQLKNITVKETLSHPTWKMGDKICVDSATLMNKGFEIIEAKYLFGLKDEQIEVVIHPESIVHSFVQFKDGSVKAQLCPPDMKIPITYALSYPQRIKTNWQRIDFAKLSKLTFVKPDQQVFKGLQLAQSALKKGGKAPAILRKANDEAVEKFLTQKMKFNQIYDYICEKTGL